MRSKRLACIVLTAFLAVACKSPGEKLSDSTDKVDSWCASLQMLCATWLRGSTPTVFAKGMAKTAADELKKELKSIDKLKVSDADKDALTRATTELRDLSAQLSEEFDHGARSEVAATATSLERLGRKLDSMKQQSGGS